MDLCESIFSHEMAVRRLLTLLRHTQSSCSDIECYQTGPPGESNDSTVVLMTVCYLALAFLLFALRRSTSSATEDNMKPGSGDQGSGGSPPPQNALWNQGPWHSRGKGRTTLSFHFKLHVYFLIFLLLYSLGCTKLLMMISKRKGGQNKGVNTFKLWIVLSIVWIIPPSLYSFSPCESVSAD